MADSCDRGAATESDERSVPDLAAGGHQVLLRMKAKQYQPRVKTQASHTYMHIRSSPFGAVLSHATPTVALGGRVPSMSL